MNTDRQFTPDALFDQAGSHRLVHLDKPDQVERDRRVELVRSGAFFDDGCPICQAQRARGGDILFEPDLESPDDSTISPQPEPEEPTLVWRRTYVDPDLPPSPQIYCTAIAFMLLELIDDITLLGKTERWAESIRHYCANFSRFSPPLSGSNLLGNSPAEARNLGAMVFQLRSYLGWFGEINPTLEPKCKDMDRNLAKLLELIRKEDA